MKGLLMIGDVHLTSRVPGFRSDDYPMVMLDKLAWALDYAKPRELVPFLLGDLFHWPRENANWLIAHLLDLIEEPVWAIVGNHDIAENCLRPDDSLSLLIKAGKIKILTNEIGYDGAISVRGTSWHEELPTSLDRNGAGPQILLTHHDVIWNKGGFGKTEPYPISGVDMVINGHIHTPEEPVEAGETLWCNPGSLCRLSRGATTLTRQPSVLKVTLSGKQLKTKMIKVPHKPYDKVFYPEEEKRAKASADSLFIDGIQELEKRKTASGAGLPHFLEANYSQFSPEVVAEIKQLANEVLDDRQ